MNAIKSTVRFPCESADYRSARDELLADEAALRRHVEAVAAKRRALPLGGEAADYAFEERGPDGARTVRLTVRRRTSGSA